MDDILDVINQFVGEEYDSANFGIDGWNRPICLGQTVEEIAAKKKKHGITGTR